MCYKKQSQNEKGFATEVAKAKPAKRRMETLKSLKPQMKGPKTYIKEAEDKERAEFEAAARALQSP